MLQELDALPANASSAYLKVRRNARSLLTRQMAWVDPQRSGKITSSQVQAVLPGLSGEDATSVAALDQTAAEWHYDYEINGNYFYKARARPEWPEN